MVWVPLCHGDWRGERGLGGAVPLCALRRWDLQGGRPVSSAVPVGVHSVAELAWLGVG